VETYGNSPRYNLGVSEFTVTGIIKVFPMAVITAFYRPFIYEALSVSLLLNGIESVVLLWFTLKFRFNGSLIRKIQLILSNEILSFALYFSILFGFIVSVFTFIPYFGIIISSLLPITVAWMTYDSVWYPVAVIAWFAIVQILEAYLIFPLIIGKRLQVNILVMFMMIILGGMLWGAAGMILFIPIVSLVKIMADKSDNLKFISELLKE
jgi:hypothetical protein